MKNLLTIVATTVASFCMLSGYAQSVPCPPNIDFELGTSDWNFYVGTCCPIVATTLSAAIACRHTITTSTGLSGCTGPGTGAVDQYGGFPIVDPIGGTQSLRLGNTVNGAQSEKARYYVHVPATTSAYCLIYRYAIVFQQPSHPPADMPRFEINAFDSATGTPVTGAHHTYVSGAAIPGFITNSTCATCVPVASAGSNVLYKDWSTATIDLSGLGGHTIMVDFMSGDCNLGGHFTYGYVDMTCGLFEIGVTLDCDTTMAELRAPEGYASFDWYDAASMTTSLGTGITAWVPVSSVTATYAVVLTPYPGFGPVDTLYTNVVCALCSGMPASVPTGASTLVAGSTTTIGLDLPGYPFVAGLTYQWLSSPDSATWTAITGATDSVYTFAGLTATTYFRCEITCTATGITTATDGIRITYLSSVITNSVFNKESNINIYPNPVKDELNVTSEKGTFSYLTITNAVGQEIVKQEMKDELTRVGVKTLPAGVYYITLSGEQGNAIRKFVKW